MATERASLRLEVALGDASFSAEGDADRVMDAFQTFRDDFLMDKRHVEDTHKPEKPKAPDPQSETKPGANGAGDGKADPDAAFAKGKPLGVFLNEKNPKGNAATAVVMAVWANANEKKSAFTIDLMEDLWRRSPRKKPTNVPRDLREASKKGWLNEAGRGTYSLPTYGINYVRDDLPAKKDTDEP
jgi:hypothetical protein